MFSGVVPVRSHSSSWNAASLAWASANVSGSITSRGADHDNQRPYRPFQRPLRRFRHALG